MAVQIILKPKADDEFEVHVGKKKGAIEITVIGVDPGTDYEIRRVSGGESNPDEEDLEPQPVDTRLLDDTQTAHVQDVIAAIKGGTATPELVLTLLPLVKTLVDKPASALQALSMKLGLPVSVQQIVDNKSAVMSLIGLPTSALSVLLENSLKKFKKKEEEAPIPKALPVDAFPLDKLDFGASESTNKYFRQVGGLDALKGAPINISFVNRDDGGAFNWENSEERENDCFYVHVFDSQGRGIGCHPASMGRNTDLRDVAPRTQYALVYHLKRENGGAGDMIGRSLVTVV
jgi:hypothetical protein